MIFTFSQKKKEVGRFIETYYGPSLREAGFVSYKNEGFFWYKVQNDLLYKIAFPLSSKRYMMVNAFFGVAPLFAWDYIPPEILLSEWYGQTSSNESYLMSRRPSTQEIVEQLIGTLPRSFADMTRIAHPTERGMMITHLMTERCGAEELDEMIFPVFNQLQSVEAVYEWHKRCKRVVERVDTDEDYVAHMTEEFMDERKKDNLWNQEYSIIFTEECLYFRDEKYYPLCLCYLQSILHSMRWIEENSKTKEKRMEYEETERHVRRLIQMLESGDFSLLNDELAQTKERMIAQLRKKRPELKIG